MNNLYFFLLFLLSILPSYAQELKHIKFEQLRPSQQKLIIRDLKSFAAEYEQKKFKEAKYSFLLNILDYQDAYAAYGDSCLFGGWPSITDGNGFCIRPQKASKTYPQYENKCASGELYCNPTLFGENLCVPFRNSADRNSSFKNCEQVFQDTGRDLDEVAIETDAKEFLELAGSVEEVCNYGQQSVTGMCQAIKYKMRHYIQDDTSSFIQNVISAKKTKNPNDITSSIGEAQTRLEYLSDLINTECSDNNLNEAKIIKCQGYAKEFENLEKYTQELIIDIETNDPKLYRQLTCVPADGNAPLDEFVDDSMKVAGGVGCTEAEIQHKEENCNRDMACAAASTMASMMPIAALLPKNNCINMQDSCLTNLITAFAKNITDLLTGIWKLLGMAGDWIADKAGDFWDWATGAEDASADKQLLAAGLSEEDVNELAEDPRAWYTKLWDGVKSSIDHFMKHNVGCQQWAGVPNYSKCLKPFKGWECQSCKTYLTGFCTAAGYIMPEVLMVIGTGGLGNFIKSGAKAGATVAKAMVKAGKATKIGAAIAKNPLVKTMVKAGTKFAGAARSVANYGGKLFDELAKGFRKLGEMPGIKQTKDLIGKIAEKSKTAVNKTQVGKAYTKVERVVNDGLTNMGKGMEKSADDLARQIHGGGTKAAGVTTQAGSSVSRNALKMDDAVIANSKLDNSARMAKIQKEYPKLTAAQQKAVMDAHNKVPCKVYLCSDAELKRKLDIMREAGVPSDVAKDAIRKGLAGDINDLGLSRPDFRKNNISDAREEFVTTVRGDNIEASTKAAEEYYTKIKKMDKAVKDDMVSVMSDSKRRITENAEWADDYIKRMEAEGKIKPGTYDKLKDAENQMENAAKEAKALEAQKQKTMQDNFQADLKQYKQENLDEMLKPIDANAYDDALRNSEKALDDLDALEKKIRADAKAAGVEPALRGDDAAILAQQALNRIDEARKLPTSRISNINRILSESEEVVDYSLKFNKQRALEIIEEDGFRAAGFSREATEHIEDLKAIQNRMADGRLKPNQVDGLMNLDIEAEIKKFENFLKEITN